MCLSCSSKVNRIMAKRFLRTILNTREETGTPRDVITLLQRYIAFPIVREDLVSFVDHSNRFECNIALFGEFLHKPCVRTFNSWQRSTFNGLNCTDDRSLVGILSYVRFHDFEAYSTAIKILPLGLDDCFTVWHCKRTHNRIDARAFAGIVLALSAPKATTLRSAADTLLENYPCTTNTTNTTIP